MLRNNSILQQKRWRRKLMYLFFVLLPTINAFSSPTPSVKCYINSILNNKRPSCLLQSNSNNDEPQSSSSSPTTTFRNGNTNQLFVDLTPQERILKEALGIEPETAAEKEQREKERRAKIEKIENEKKKNIAVAILSFTVACLNYCWQYTHPVTSLSLLTQMQRNSDDITLIGKNGKPTVVDFWAPWCENCKSAAPTLSKVEDEYRNRVNFVMVNGDLDENWPLIERFGVDAIPHLAMIGSDGYVETALIGPIPKTVLKADLDVMIENAKIRNLEEGGNVDMGNVQERQRKNELPYMMYDAFRSRPDLRIVKF